MARIFLSIIREKVQKKLVCFSFCDKFQELLLGCNEPFVSIMRILPQ